MRRGLCGPVEGHLEKPPKAVQFRDSFCKYIDLTFCQDTAGDRKQTRGAVL